MRACWMRGALAPAVMVAALAASGVACSGGTSSTPSVDVVDVSPVVLELGNDLANDLSITVAYQDGDGDLGEGRALIHDCRAPAVVTTLDLPAIASAEGVAEQVTIAGEIDLHVADVGPVTAGTPPNACDTVSVPAGSAIFCVVLQDRAAHASEPACTSAIALE